MFPYQISWQFSPPVVPVWLVALCAIGLFVLLLWGTRLLIKKQAPVRWVRILFVLRVLIILVFVLLLFQPMLHYKRDIHVTPELMILVDTSESMSRLMPRQQKTYGEHFRDSFLTSGLREHLENRYRLHWFSFDQDARVFDPDQEWSSQRYEGASTQTSASIRTAWDAVNQNSSRTGEVQPLREVLVLGDGHDTGRESLTALLREQGLTFHAYVPEDVFTEEKGSVGIRSVQSSRRVALQSYVPFVVRLSRQPGPVEQGKVYLYLGNEELSSVDLLFEPGQTDVSVSMLHRPNRVGVHSYVVSLLSPEERAKLLEEGANLVGREYSIGIDVVDHQLEVLLWEGSSRWSFRFLRRLLEDDPTFAFSGLVGRGRMYAMYGEQDRRARLGGVPQSLAELSQFDVIVLGDVDIRQWSAGFVRSLEQWVVQEGRTLIVTASPRLDLIRRNPVLHRLLPVVLNETSSLPIKGPVAARKSAEGFHSAFFMHPLFENVSLLPPLENLYVPDRKRPGATVLMETAAQANRGPMIILAEQPAGRGRVFYVGTDSLWNWQMNSPIVRTGETYYSAFWQQALRALTPMRSQSSDQIFWVQPERSRYEVGEAGRIFFDLLNPVVAPEFRAIAQLPDGREESLQVRAGAEIGRYEAVFSPSMAGLFQIRAELWDEGRLLAERTSLLDVDQPRSEMAVLGVNRELLEQVTQGTDGSILSRSTRDLWPTPKFGNERVPHDFSWDLWNSGFLLLLLIGLLGVDWLIRLLRGMF